MKILTNKFFKPFLLLTTISLIIEIIFKIVMNLTIFDWSLLRIFIGLSIINIFFSFLISFGNRIVSNIFIIIVSLIMSIYSFIQASFYSYLGTYMSIATSTQAGAVGGFIEDFFSSIKVEYYTLFIPIVLLIIYLIIFDKKIFNKYNTQNNEELETIKGKKRKQLYIEEQETSNKKKILIIRISSLVSLIVLCVLYYGTLKINFMQNEFQMMSNIELFKNPSMPNIAVSQFGINGFGIIDVKTLIFPYENDQIEEVFVEENDDEIVIDDKRKIDDTVWKDANKKESNKNYVKLNNYFMSKEITPTNDYTGIFEDKNLIVIMIESGSNVLQDYPEYFPNINKLYNNGWAWTNAYSPRNACSTGNNEMSGITSLYTINRECTANIYKDNTYFESMFNLFNNKEYKTSSYHDYTDHFYERHVYHPNMGSSKYYGVDELGIKLGNEYQPWPSDVEFVEKSMPFYINEDKFMVWLTTVSSHMSYINSSVTGDMNVDMFKDKDWNIALKRYMSKLKIFDDSLGKLLKGLEENNRLNDTVIVLYADHEPYGLAQDVFDDLTKYDIKQYGDVDRTPFIIYNPEITPMKNKNYTSFIDLLPTIANLFNLDYDPRLYGGHDLFDENHPNVVAFADGSWRSDIAYYEATSGKISYTTDKKYTDREIKEINNKISNEMKMDNLAIKENYFEYLGNILNTNIISDNNDVELEAE